MKNQPLALVGVMKKAANSNIVDYNFRTHVEFEKPPVVETSLGFYFSPLSKWSVVQYGQLWDRFKSRYPSTEFKPPIGNVQVSFAPNVDLGNFPLRAMFLDKTKTQLLQIQNGIFFRNWRKTPETPRYQHYDEIRPLFEQDWSIFVSYMSETFGERPGVTRCEMSYFNHLVRGEDWNDFSDLPELYTAWKGTVGSVLLKPRMINISAMYELPEGFVQINSQPGVRQIDGKEIIQLTITAQIEPVKQTDQELYRSLEICHESNIRAFLEFTTDKLQQIWKRRT